MTTTRRHNKRRARKPRPCPNFAPVLTFMLTVAIGAESEELSDAAIVVADHLAMLLPDDVVESCKQHALAIVASDEVAEVVH